MNERGAFKNIIMKKSIFKRTIEIIIFVVFLFFLFAPLFSTIIWSVALRWYWPHTFPQKIGFDYWLQALGITKSLHCHYCSYNNYGNCHSGRLCISKT